MAHNNGNYNGVKEKISEAKQGESDNEAKRIQNKHKRGSRQRVAAYPVPANSSVSVPVGRLDADASRGTGAATAAFMVAAAAAATAAVFVDAAAVDAAATAAGAAAAIPFAAAAADCRRLS